VVLQEIDEDLVLGDVPGALAEPAPDGEVQLLHGVILRLEDIIIGLAVG
jgi:hypothetical protein